MTEKPVKTITVHERIIHLFKQGMWLIASENNIEILRIELFGKTIEEGVSEISLLILKQDEYKNEKK